MLVETPEFSNSQAQNDPGYWVKLLENHKEEPLKVLGYLKTSLTQLSPPNSYVVCFLSLG